MWLITFKELQGPGCQAHAACLRWRCASFSIFSSRFQTSPFSILLLVCTLCVNALLAMQGQVKIDPSLSTPEQEQLKSHTIAQSSRHTQALQSQRILSFNICFYGNMSTIKHQAVEPFTASDIGAATSSAATSSSAFHYLHINRVLV